METLLKMKGAVCPICKRKNCRECVDSDHKKTVSIEIGFDIVVWLCKCCGSIFQPKENPKGGVNSE